MTGKYRLTTLGCKVNQYESEQVRQVLESLGLRPAQPGEHADVAIANTCAVTCSATAKSRQTLRKLARDGARTIAIGCYASADPDAIARIPGIERAIGHDEDALAQIREWIVRQLPRGELAGDGPVNADPVSLPPGPEASPGLVQVGLRLSRAPEFAPPKSTPSPPNLDGTTTTYSINRELPLVNSNPVFTAPIREFADHTRAFLKIQDGCDAHCTYCIIPRLRKTLRSKPIEVAVTEAQQLVAAGHREIVLTGIFLGAYGRETALRKRFAPGPSPLAALVDALARVDGLDRLRLSSLEPGDVDDALLEVLVRHDACVPHLHLPLQAGSADILRQMNRQYALDEFEAMIDRVNAALDRPAITTDIIVGFPGETDALFEQTLATARQSGFCKIHAFPFSPRPGTAAARWGKKFVHPATVKARMEQLRALERDLAAAYQQQFVGEATRVLVERRSENIANNGGQANVMATGRCDRYFEVHFPADGARPGDLVQVQIERTTPTRAHGRRVHQAQQAVAIR